MSSTNRGAQRRADDHYQTPEWLTRAILPVINRRALWCPPAVGPAQILEPAAGRGAITGVLHEAYPTATVVAYDLHWLGTDFLAATPQREYDLIITNPPYSLAFDFVRAALFGWRRGRHSVVAMLLRLGFLAGQKRAAFFREHTPSIYVTPRRPSFTGNGTDSADYAWFVWDGREPTVGVLETERAERAGGES